MDITDLFEIIEKLEKAKAIAESANKAKSDFLATMSHEIRTPINGIVGMAELLENAKLTPLERENLKALQYSAEVLLSLINDILDLAKIEAQQLALDFESIDTQEFLSDVVATSQILVKDKPVELKLDVEEELPEVYADRIRLQQILNNLVSNAAKFTEEGRIIVTTSLE